MVRADRDVERLGEARGERELVDHGRIAGCDATDLVSPVLGEPKLAVWAEDDVLGHGGRRGYRELGSPSALPPREPPAGARAALSS
jgi:hypothetical protein